MTLKYDALIFDMDGTLLDSMPYWRMQNLVFLREHNLPVPEQMRGRETEISSRLATQIFVETFHLPMTPEEIFHGHERRMLDNYLTVIREKPGAKAFLERMARLNQRMCVATATPSDIAAQALEKQGMLKYFEFVVSREELGATKNEPVFFERVARRLDASCARLAMFEDALYAIQSACAAGMDLFAIYDDTARADAPRIKQLCRRYFESYDQLEDGLFVI